MINMKTGTIDEKLIEQWDESYSKGELPDGFEFAGPAHSGRPKMYDEDMTTLTIRIPVSQKNALIKEAKKSKQSMSEYTRNLITIGMM